MRFVPALATALFLALAAPIAAPIAAPGAFTVAAQPANRPTPPASSAASQPPANQLPADAATHHVLDLPGRSLHFTATVGTIRPTDEAGKEQAQIEYMAYTLDGADPHTRPVMFFTNGGPGSASVWLQLGAAGPWHVPMDGGARTPSAPAVAVDNPDTWLDFTDLVFIDPAGTGWSRLADDTEPLRRHVWSVDGDVQVLADTIRRWLQANGRMASPKYFTGESYAGLRGPRLARTLPDQEGVALSGLILISPYLDGSIRGGAFDPVGFLTNLPSMAAVAHHLPPDGLAAVEQYATGEYWADLLRGQADPAVLDRMSARVADLTGLDPALVRRHNGRVTTYMFLREHDPGFVESIYDGTLTVPNPFPEYYVPNVADPTFTQFGPVMSSALVDLVTTRLNWHPEATYELGNSRALREWDWGNRQGKPEAMTALRNALAADPNFHVLIGHGVDDLILPYFATKLLLSQLPSEDFATRVHLVLHEGGHMFYSRDASRTALHDEARSLVTEH